LKLAILGAGISGLSLARFLMDGGIPADDIHLLEADSIVGGLCRSKTVDGFTYDVAGGHILYSKDAEMMQWMRDCAGGDAGFVKRDRNTRIRFDDRWVPYPFENGIGALPQEANFDCIRGYVHAWHARSSDGSTAPGEFGKWIRWRFGDGIAKHFMDPYNEKVWKRDLDFLTSDWVAGRVPDAPVDDVLRSAVGIQTEGYKHQAIFYYPKVGGFQAITDGMAKGPIAPRIRLNTRAEDMVRSGDGWRINGEEFDLVVSTLSLDLLPNLIQGMPDGVVQAMRTLEYNGLVSYLVALDRPEHPNYSWVYLPQPKQGPANRLTYMSNYAESNAPEGKTSFLVEITAQGGKAFPEASFQDEVLQGLEQAGIMKRDEVLFTDRHDVERAYIVFDHGYAARRKTAIDWLEGVGVYPHGRFGRYDYDNSDQCVIKSRALADRLLAKIQAG
jgi:protoporphyrinogen oxidase